MKTVKGVAQAIVDGKQKAATSQKPDRTDEQTADSWTIGLEKTRICTLDQMVEACKIDLEIWEVERFLCNKWDVGAIPRATKEHSDEPGENSWIRPHRLDTPAAYPAHNEKHNGGLLRVYPLFQVKVWLKKKVVIELIKRDIAALKLEAAKWSPRPIVVVKALSSASGIWVEHCLFDHHFGALIWDKETGREPYDLKIATKCWSDALGVLASRADPFKPEGMLFPIGNDQINADNRAGGTEMGTPQSNDSRYQKVYTVSRDATVWAIKQGVARYNRVHVVPVMGNHDPLSTWHLGEYLAAVFANDKRVTIDNSPAPRKWWEYGVNMLMYTHGDKGKLEEYGRTMASEQPEMWGRTRVREAHTGHVHHKRTWEFDGYTARSLSSLRPVCAWSSENMYGAIRAAESFLWSKTEGLVGTANYSILPKMLT